MRSSNYQLSLLKIPVSQLQVRADFYRERLGFDEQFVVEEYGRAQYEVGGLPR